MTGDICSSVVKSTDRDVSVATMINEWECLKAHESV